MRIEMRRACEHDDKALYSIHLLLFSVCRIKFVYTCSIPGRDFCFVVTSMMEKSYHLISLLTKYSITMLSSNDEIIFLVYFSLENR